VCLRGKKCKATGPGSAVPLEAVCVCVQSGVMEGAGVVGEE